MGWFGNEGWRGGGEGPAFASAVCSKMHALSVRWGWVEVAAGAMVLWDMVEVTERWDGWMDGWEIGVHLVRNNAILQPENK